MKLKSDLQKYLGERLQAAVEIQNLVSLSGGGGACQDNYALDLQVDRGEFEGEHALVLRTDKGSSLFASISKQDEFGVTELAWQNGVRTPRPYWKETNTGHTGNAFFLMERIGGKANGRFIVKDPSLKKVRASLPDELAANLVKIHAIAPADCRDAGLKQVLLAGTPDPARYVEHTLRALRPQIDALPDPHPAMELVLNWALNNQPAVSELQLVHGDFRTGNFMVSADGLEGILDWEFAHFGDPAEDIAWLCMRDWRFGKHNLEAGGISKRADFYSVYEKHSGQAVDPERVRFWEVIGNLRWAIGSAGQAERHLSGKDKGIELAAIGRRCAEMEYEAMRLIENAG
ncbi:MAG: phosphotransferase family protein [Leptospiraceae bacterium]|nr:phosphotransferase family protein [Leptospiraceae bacterium]